MPKDEKRSGRKAGERTYVAAVGAALATATAAACGGVRLYETDYLAARVRPRAGRREAEGEGRRGRMSVKKCRYCKHWADGRCLDEEVRGRRWSDGSLFDPPTRGAEDGCLWRFEDKEREENGNG